MDRNASFDRQRHGHQVAFGDETDDLDTQPVGRTLSRPRGVGTPEVTDRDVPDETNPANEGAPGSPGTKAGISNRGAEMEGNLTGGDERAAGGERREGQAEERSKPVG